MNTSACLIGLDWGTSSLRAYLLARDGTAIGDLASGQPDCKGAGSQDRAAEGGQAKN